MMSLHFIKCTMGKFQCIYIGLCWSHYVNVMDTKVPGQEHLITGGGAFILKLGKSKVSVQEDPCRRDISKSNTIFDNHLFI